MRMLVDHYGTDRLMICMHPTTIDLLRDACRDRSIPATLERQWRNSDRDPAKQALCLGLAGARTRLETMASRLTTTCCDTAHESDRIHDAGFESHIIPRGSDDPRTPSRHSGTIS